MNILILGGGGREHALGWKLKQSKNVNNIYFSPGNGGTSSVGVNIEIDISDEKSLLSTIKQQNIDFVVIGPDDYLANGLTNLLEEKGIKVFGPTKEASEIEWSKSFAKQFMIEEGIPTAEFKDFSDFKEAQQYLEQSRFPIVIKADGLALGKGVVIAKNINEAQKALQEMMLEKVHGIAGNKVVIEEYLEGKEISAHAFCDGENIIMFPPAQDHKPIYDNDKGPNTGGMGTVASLPWVTKSLMKEIENTIVLPTIKGLKKRGRIFKGILFPGIMVTKSGPRVIEFNARFGDPETQSYMRILKTDLLDILLACSDGGLSKTEIEWEDEFACCIVLASAGYPKGSQKGVLINGMDNNVPKNIEIFHAGTKMDGGKLLTNGSRVLNVTAVGSDLKKSINEAYKAISSINFDGMQYRKDIGNKSL
jgi:phosphoribosylamine---glycine ligase